MDKIPLYKSYSDARDIEAVSEIIKSQTHWAEGQSIEEFERGLCRYTEVSGALVCNSGTSALHMALLASGVKHFHDVIVPSFTFIATANAVKFIGAKPVFADIEPDTFGLDPADVERKITIRTKAIIAVHYAGCPCRIQELRKIARNHNLVLIEDAAESLGAKVNGIPVGKFGDCAILSFCANKIISTGEGGALITDDKYIYDRAKLLRSHGRNNDNYFNSNEADSYTTLGYNFRMSSMSAALGISQLAKIDLLIEFRQCIAGQYIFHLSNIPNIIIPGINEKLRHVYQLFTIQILNRKRDQVMRHLAESGIGCKVYFRPVHLTEFYRQHSWQPVSLPVTEQISSEVLSLPMYPGLTEQEIQTICDKIKEVI